MKNKKGFTLIELLAVILVLGIIALIAVPVVNKVIEQSKKEAAEVSALGYIEAVEKHLVSSVLGSNIMVLDINATYQVSEVSYSSQLETKEDIYLNDIIKISGTEPASGVVTINDELQVSYAELEFGKYIVIYQNDIGITEVLKSGEISVKSIEITCENTDIRYGDVIDLIATINPSDATNKKLVWESSDESIATVDENGQVITKKKGEVTITARAVNGIKGEYLMEIGIPLGAMLYYDPAAGQVCDTYQESLSSNGNKAGCMKWYYFSTNEDGTNNYILDHNTTPMIQWNSNEKTKTGPTSAFINQLWSDTNGWIGVPERTDSYARDNEYSTYTINYSGHRARLMTDLEMMAIVNHGNYGWLLDRTNGNCKPDGCLNNATGTGASKMVGYWSITACAVNTNRAYRITYDYHDGCNYVGRDDIGIRPVITIPVDPLY